MKDDKCPISGLPCQNKKCIHITDIASYKEKKEYVEKESYSCCMVCGASIMNDEKHSSEANIDKIFTMLKNIVTDKIVSAFMVPPASVYMPPPQPILQCQQCGCTLAEISKNSKMGCAGCYNYFYQQIAPVLYNIHHTTNKHVGKRPIKDRLKHLEEKLADAVKNEDYESASAIRDKIKELKKN